MKQFIMLCLLISILPVCKAQEEVIFNNLDVDKKEIKVAKVIQGFEFSNDFIRILPGQYDGFVFGSVETHLGYFHENRIANSWTLNKSIGLGNSFYRIYEYHSDGTPWGGAIRGDKVYQYRLSLDLKIEPRWYFDQRLRYQHNKNTSNNSGWFLSMPLTLSTNLLRQPVGDFNTQWSQKLIINIVAPLTIGYRNSFAKNWFMEVNAGYIPIRAWYYNGSFIMKSASKIGVFSADSFNSELKIAYTF